METTSEDDVIPLLISMIKLMTGVFVDDQNRFREDDVTRLREWGAVEIEAAESSPTAGKWFLMMEPKCCIAIVFVTVFFFPFLSHPVSDYRLLVCGSSPPN